MIAGARSVLFCFGLGVASAVCLIAIILRDFWNGDL